VLPRQPDAIFTAVVLILVVLALALSGQLIAEPPLVLSRNFSPLNPRLFPTLVLAGTGVAAAGFLVRRGLQGAAKAGAAGEEIVWSNPRGVRRQVLFLVLTIVCALLLAHIGYLTTMFVLMVGTSLLVGNSSILQILGLSTALPLGFYIVVTHVLKTALPEIDAIERVLSPILSVLPTF